MHSTVNILEKCINILVRVIFEAKFVLNICQFQYRSVGHLMKTNTHQKEKYSPSVGKKGDTNVCTDRMFFQSQADKIHLGPHKSNTRQYFK